MKGVPVKTTVSPFECAVWSAEFVRVRATHAEPSSHAAVGAAIDAADQVVIDLRDAFGTEHSSLAMRELRDDPAAQLETLRKRLDPDAPLETARSLLLHHFKPMTDPRVDHLEEAFEKITELSDDLYLHPDDHPMASIRPRVSRVREHLVHARDQRFLERTSR